MSEYELTLDFLYKQLPFFQRDGKKAYKPGLDTIRQMCDILGNPQEKFPSVHIGGTNGKGSTSHMTSAVLQSAGYRVGLYTSPHLKSFTERIKVDGKEIDEKYVVSFVKSNKDLIASFQPSFFEWTLLIAFSYFAEMQVDIAVIEVGLGGRLDSTNIIHPITTLITNIGLDHTDILGNTKESIAKEKSGIFKKKSGAIVVDASPETRHVFEHAAESVGVDVTFLKDFIEVEYNKRVNTHSHEIDFVLIDKSRSLELDLSSGLIGAYQRDNFIGVYGIYQYLNAKTSFFISDSAFKNGIKEVTKLTNLKGRWQCLGEKPLIVADTGHNTHAFEEHSKYLNSWPSSKLHLVLGFMKEKNIDGILELLPKDATFYFCEIANNHRSLSTIDLQEIGVKFNLSFSVHRDVNSVVSLLQETLDEDCFVFIGGSTFLVAELNNL